jgi:hypothetical protein
MIEVIDKGMNANVIALSAYGKVTHQDYVRVLIPAVEEKIRTNDKIRLFYHLGEGITGFDLEAIWDDARTGLKHFSAFEKIAVVTDIVPLRDAIKVFRVFRGCPVQVYSNEDFAEAASWINTPAP